MFQKTHLPGIYNENTSVTHLWRGKDGAVNTYSEVTGILLN